MDSGYTSNPTENNPTEYGLWAEMMGYAVDRRDDTLRHTLQRLRPHWHYLKMPSNDMPIVIQSSGMPLSDTESDEKTQEDKVYGCHYSEALQGRTAKKAVLYFDRGELMMITAHNATLDFDEGRLTTILADTIIVEQNLSLYHRLRRFARHFFYLD